MNTDLSSVAWPVSIGQAAQLSGISPKMLRHYESLGLLGALPRTEGNYRQYAEADVHTLRFIRRARDMGFTLDEIRDLVNLWHNRRRSSENVKRIAQHHIEELGERIAALEAMRRTLQDLVQRCPGNQRPDCPILDDLGGAGDTGLYRKNTETPRLLHG
jgi:Cu(I)-responsive transcriptional regulator